MYKLKSRKLWVAAVTSMAMLICGLLELAPGGTYQDHDLVFPSPTGGPQDGSGITRTWCRLRNQVGLPEMALHDLRHLHASLLLKQGIHPRVVQERLGHASVTTTLDLYSHVLPGLQERAAQAFSEAMDRPSEEAVL